MTSAQRPLPCTLRNGRQGQDKGEESISLSTNSAKGTGKASLSSKKKQHQRVNCQACDVQHYAFQALLPSWGKKSSNGLQNVVNRTQKRVLQPSNPSNVRPTLKAIKRTVSIIYNEIDGPFKELFSMSFAKAQTKTSELNLQEKKYQAQLKKERREKLRSKLRNNGQNGIVTPCWALGRHTVSDRNSVWLWSLRPQMK